MKKLFVITIIACVSSSAFARQAFLGEFDTLVAAALAAQAKSDATKKNTTKKEISEEYLSYLRDSEKQFYGNQLAQEQQSSDNESELNSYQHGIDLLTANAVNFAKYKNETNLANEYTQANSNDKTIKNERLKQYRTNAKAKRMLFASDAKKRVKITTAQDETETAIALDEFETMKRNSHTEKCLNQIKALIGVYQMNAVQAMDSDFLRECPGAEATVNTIMAEHYDAVEDSYDYNIAANRWSAEDNI